MTIATVLKTRAHTVAMASFEFGRALGAVRVPTVGRDAFVESTRRAGQWQDLPPDHPRVERDMDLHLAVRALVDAADQAVASATAARRSEHTAEAETAAGVVLDQATATFTFLVEETRQVTKVTQERIGELERELTELRQELLSFQEETMKAAIAGQAFVLKAQAARDAATTAAEAAKAP